MNKMKKTGKWETYFKSAQRYVTAGDYIRALEYLKEAVKDCPAEENKDLSKILLYLGIVLSKLGCFEGAFKSWNSILLINREKKLTNLVKRLIDHARKESFSVISENDREMFISIQIEKYLSSKPVDYRCTKEENDFLLDLFDSYWDTFIHETSLRGMSKKEKKAIFYHFDIIIPEENESFLYISE